MDPNTIATIIDSAKSHWTAANDIEITLEANPGSVEAGRFAGFRDAGVNRVSLGVQALNDKDLRRLGRIHSVDDAKVALGIAQNCFDRVSFDLIYGRQNQTLESWKDELKQSLTLASDHISLYQLTIENGTAFADRFAAGGLAGLPSEDLGADMYQSTLDICADHGLNAYEVSNFARPGSESRHNLIYWRYGDYAGIGPGAHGRVTIDGSRHATECVSMPNDWLAAANTGGAELPRQTLNHQEQANEFLMMSLRLSEGLDPARYLALYGRELDPVKLSYLRQLGMVTFHNKNICATNKGRLILNAVIRELLAG